MGQKLNYILFTISSNSSYLKRKKRDCDYDPGVKNPPYKVGDTDAFPGRETKVPYAVGQPSLRALEPVRPATVCRLWSPRAATGEAYALQLKKALVPSRGSRIAKTKEMQKVFFFK